MTKIIGISGRKQSGKNTVANIINGDVLKDLKMIQDYRVGSDGQLNILTTNRDNVSGWGILDLLRRDKDFVSYAEYNIWPYIKIHHFADYLKMICIDLFDFEPKQAYGTDEDKNTYTKYGMTAREFLQHFGTNVMREIKDTVWLDRTMKTIEEEQSVIAVIPDVRFPNEVHAIKDAGGFVIRLTRDTTHSTHQCESALNQDVFDWDIFDYIIDNQEYNISELQEQTLLMNHIWRN